MMLSLALSKNEKQDLLSSVRDFYISQNEKQQRLDDITGRLADLFIKCEIDDFTSRKALVQDLETAILSADWSLIGIALDMIINHEFNGIPAGEKETEAAQDLDADIQSFIWDYDIIPADF